MPFPDPRPEPARRSVERSVEKNAELSVAELSVAELSVDELTVRLTDRLSDIDCQPRPLQWNMTPQLAYGRHRGPARLNSRQAAVCVGLYWDTEDGWVFPLTRRPQTLRHHAGQICFPGGRIESGETPAQAALREFEEELGRSADVIRVCGQLPLQYVYASDNEVTPVVCVLRKPTLPWNPDPGEVDEVILLPLSVVTQQSAEPTRNHSTRPPTIWHRRIVHAADDPTIEVGQVRFSAPAFAFQSQRIWGATAVILDQLAQCLLSTNKNFKTRVPLPTWPIRYHRPAEALVREH